MSDFQTSARAATKTMRALFPATPLLRNDHLSAKYDADIWLKREDLSPVRSYKIRGAFNALTKARAREPAPDVFVCASAGNHAQGVAYVCQHLGVRGVIFMPITTPQQKVQKTKIFGGDAIEVILTGDYFDDTLAAAKAYCHAQGAHFLSPFDDDDVIEGQASVSVEIADQLGGTPDMVILPVGGGGLSAGATAFLAVTALPCIMLSRKVRPAYMPPYRPVRRKRWPRSIILLMVPLLRGLAIRRLRISMRYGRINCIKYPKTVCAPRLWRCSTLKGSSLNLRGRFPLICWRI